MGFFVKNADISIPGERVIQIGIVKYPEFKHRISRIGFADSLEKRF